MAATGIATRLRNIVASVILAGSHRQQDALAIENLRLGNTVVTDSVNPIHITREAWIDVARQAGVPHVEIEIICSDQNEHRKRIESREVDITGLKLPDWEQVKSRAYDAWLNEHLILDTAGRTIDESISEFYALLQK